MALKYVFNAMKQEGFVVKKLDMFLMSKANDVDENRAIDVNAPSQIGKCLRSRYYARTGVPSDPNSISGRAQRIFDNGSGAHERLQGYLKEMGMLLMEELPVHNKKYNIQGHTDGALVLTPSEKFKGYANEIAVLEIKTINDRDFSKLIDAKLEHKRQGLTYVYCLEQRRLYLQKKYKSLLQFKSSKSKRMAKYATLYQHISGGRKFTREEKIQFQCELHDVLDNILYRLTEPVTKAIFLYENKNNQELKEFTIDSESRESTKIMDEVLSECEILNRDVKNKEIPPRAGDKKTSDVCRWCDYKLQCWH